MTSPASPPVILLVEDNPDNQAIYRIVLEHSGYRVLVAGDGEAGLRSARALRPDLILMDISIPVIDGWEATRILKSEEGTKEIPVIALTAHALPGARERCAEVGCDDYLSKPISPNAVLEVVRRWVEPPA